MDRTFKEGDLVVIKDIDYLTEHQHETPTITHQMMKAHDQECVVTSTWGDGSYSRMSLLPLDESFIINVDGFSWRPSWVTASSERKISEDFMRNFQDLFD